MAKKTLLAVVLDRSGSMENVAQEASKALNSFIEEQQRSTPGKCNFTFVQFDSESTDFLHRNAKLGSVPANFQLVPRALTPLYDAIGRTVRTLDEDNCAHFDKVIVVIVTDGAENCSKEFTRAQVRTMIAEREAKGWDFVYLGAGADQFAREQHLYQASAMGLRGGATLDYAATPDAYLGAFAATSSAVTRSRVTGDSLNYTEEERASVEEASTTST